MVKRFSRERGQVAVRGDDGHLAANQIGQQRRQAIVLALQPVVLDRYVLAFDDVVFAETFAEGDRKARVGIGRPVSDKPDHRHRLLLRARGQGPSDRCTAKRGYELPSFDCHLIRPGRDHARCIVGKNITPQNGGLLTTFLMAPGWCYLYAQSI
jgi:hypothetical protein